MTGGSGGEGHDGHADVWARQAVQWSRARSPQRPAPEDVAHFAALARPWLDKAPRPPVIAVLGVTPELTGAAWPAGSQVVAVDQSAAMIGRIWSADPRLDSHAVLARWQAMPLAEGTADLVIGDGSLNALPDTAEQSKVLAEAGRVLRPGGGLILRVFVRPDAPDDVAALRARVREGVQGSFPAMKWRLALALAADSGGPVAVRRILALFDDLWPDRNRLAAETGWARGLIDTMEAYRGADTVLNFPSRDALQALTEPVFREVARRTGTYELAEHCPVTAWRKR